MREVGEAEVIAGAGVNVSGLGHVRATRYVDLHGGRRVVLAECKRDRAGLAGVVLLVRGVDGNMVLGSRRSAGERQKTRRPEDQKRWLRVLIRIGSGALGRNSYLLPSPGKIPV